MTHSKPARHDRLVSLATPGPGWVRLSLPICGACPA